MPSASSSAFLASMSSTWKATWDAPRLFEAAAPSVSLGGLLVLEQLERRVAEQQAHLAQRSAGHADRRAELRPVEPRARLVRELEAEHVVVEADRGIEILHRDAHVMQGFHAPPSWSSAARAVRPAPARRRPCTSGRSCSRTRARPGRPGTARSRRGAAGRPISVPWAKSRIGFASAGCSWIARRSSLSPTHIGVSTTPGANALTVIPCWIRPRAVAWVTASDAELGHAVGDEVPEALAARDRARC